MHKYQYFQFHGSTIYSELPMYVSFDIHACTKSRFTCSISFFFFTLQSLTNQA